MPKEKPVHNVKRVIRGVDVKHPSVEPEPVVEVVEPVVKPEPEPVVEPVVQKVIRWHQVSSQYNRNMWKKAKCDNCMYENDIKKADVVFAHPHKTKIKRYHPSQLWVSQFWESEGIYPDINTENFDASKSYRRDATFPCYAMMTDTFKPEKIIEPLPYEKKIDIEWMSVWLSNCGASGRNSLLGTLQKAGITTASYGRCKRDHSEAKLHFSSTEVDIWDRKKSSGNQKIAHSSNHLFLFAAENNISPFYHTEKLYHGLMAGSIPIYYGAETIDEYVPENSIIKVSDYGSGLGDYLKKVANDKELYESYFTWRTKPLPEYLTSKLNYKCKNACEICQDLHDMKRDIREEPVVEPEPEPVKEPNKINKTLVFTTKNRYGYVRLLAESLEWMKVYEHAHIHVFDDGSTDFDIEDLKDWFPYAQIHESDHRHADMTTRHAFEWFENESEDDILINIDSDTMLHPDWNDFIDTHIGRSGVLSLYHSGAKYHKSVNCDDVSCEKKSTGAMGIVMTRHVMEDMLHNMHDAEHKAAAFDWGFVNYFEKKGIKIIVPKNSLALHYGMYGAHGSGNHVEVANTFDFTPFPEVITKKAKAFLDNEKPDRPPSNSNTHMVDISGRSIQYSIPHVMKPSDIVIGILSYDKTKRMIMRKLYSGESYYFVVAKKNGVFDFDEFAQYNDIIFLDMEEAYFGDNSILPFKTQLFFHVFHTHISHFDYVLKLDDDSYVKMDKLRVEMKQHHYDYWGHKLSGGPIRNPRNKWHVSEKMYPGNRYPNWCSGAGYVLSKDLVRCIDSKLATHTFMPREDVSTGILAKACGSAPHHSDKVQHVKPYKSDDFIIRHYVDINEIKLPDNVKYRKPLP